MNCSYAITGLHPTTYSDHKISINGKEGSKVGGFWCTAKNHWIYSKINYWRMWKWNYSIDSIEIFTIMRISLHLYLNTQFFAHIYYGREMEDVSICSNRRTIITWCRVHVTFPISVLVLSANYVGVSCWVTIYRTVPITSGVAFSQRNLVFKQRPIGHSSDECGWWCVVQ